MLMLAEQWINGEYENWQMKQHNVAERPRSFISPFERGSNVFQTNVALITKQ